MRKPSEIWKDIEGFGYYQISNYGRVRSFHPIVCGRTQEGYRNMTHHVRILKPSESETGYLKITLSRQKKPFKQSIHRLVAQAFVLNPEHLPYVNHKDENKKNNNPLNLEWCTHKYNCNYGTRNSRQSKSMMNNASMSIPVVQMTKKGDYINTFPSLSEAERQTGARAKHIGSCCNNVYGFKSARGFKWRFAK